VLSPASRLTGIGYFIFGLLNVVMFYFSLDACRNPIFSRQT
jgi:hypothetical protein